MLLSLANLNEMLLTQNVASICNMSVSVVLIFSFVYAPGAGAQVEHLLIRRLVV